MKRQDILTPKGTLVVTARSILTGEVLSRNTYENTILSGWKEQIVKDIVNGTNVAKPEIMAFGDTADAVSPEPTALTNEVRATMISFGDEANLQMFSTLGPSSGNSISPIKAVGFYYNSPTTTLLTGTLGSLINTINETKNSTIELTFQYTVTFS